MNLEAYLQKKIDCHSLSFEPKCYGDDTIFFGSKTSEEDIWKHIDTYFSSQGGILRSSPPDTRIYKFQGEFHLVIMDKFGSDVIIDVSTYDKI